MHLSDRSKAILTGALVVFFVVLLLGLAEGAIRLRQWVKYGRAAPLETVYTVDNERRLRVPVANVRAGTIRINSLGFRGPEIKNPKPVGTLRIAFLGASTTFCAEVSSNELTWPHLVVERLQDAYPNRSVDYVNGAVPGYTLQSSLRNLRTRVAPLDPDVIIIYHATNDLSAEMRALAAEQGLYNVEESGRGSWLGRYSLLWYLVEKNLRIVKLQNQAKQNQERLKFRPEQLGVAFRSQLTELVHEAKAHAKLVVLVTFAHRIRLEQNPEEQVRAAASALYYMPFMTPNGLVAAFTRYNEIIREVGRDTGSLLVSGEMEIPADDEHFNDTVHFKDAGSRAMAQRVGEALLKAPAFRALIEVARYRLPAAPGATHSLYANF